MLALNEEFSRKAVACVDHCQKRNHRSWLHVAAISFSHLAAN